MVFKFTFTPLILLCIVGSAESRVEVSCRYPYSCWKGYGVVCSNQAFPVMPPGCNVYSLTVENSGPLLVPSRALENVQVIPGQGFYVRIFGNPLVLAPDAFAGFTNDLDLPVHVTLVNEKVDGDPIDLTLGSGNFILTAQGFGHLDLTSVTSLPGLVIDYTYMKPDDIRDMHITWPSDGNVKLLSITAPKYPTTDGTVRPSEFRMAGSRTSPTVPMANLFPGLHVIDFTDCTSINIWNTYYAGVIALPFGSMSNLTSINLANNGISRIPSGTFEFPEQQHQPVEIMFSHSSVIKISTGAFKNTGDIKFAYKCSVEIIQSGAFDTTGSIYLGNNQITKIVNGTFQTTGNIDLSNNAIEAIETAAFDSTGSIDLSRNFIEEIAPGAFDTTGDINFNSNKITKIGTDAFNRIGSIDLSNNSIEQMESGAFQNIASLVLDNNQIKSIKEGVFLKNITRISIVRNPITEIEPDAFGPGIFKLNIWLYKGASISVDAFRQLEGIIYVTLWGESETDFTITGSSIAKPPRSKALLFFVCEVNSSQYCPKVDKQICTVFPNFQADTNCYCSDLVLLC